MEIIRKGKEIKLTNQELFDAYMEQRSMFDIQNIEDNMENCLDKSEYDLLKDNREFIEEAALELRRNQDKYDMDFENAIRDAFDDIKVKYLKPKKTYKNFEKQYIGISDIASLVLVGCQKDKGLVAIPLDFGKDGSYSAYIVEGEAEIGSHYEKRAEFNSWLKIYDDEEIVRKFKGKKIIVYRAAEMGCIIQIIQ